MEECKDVIVTSPTVLVRQATDVAGACREIVTKTALQIQGRKYVRVEGWQSIAIAHGCVLSARDVQKVDGGFSAIGEVRRMSDGLVLATAEGFVGDDEPTWSGGELRGKHMEARPVYARRAMAQTRAMSRAARTAFAHVVVMMDAGLSTTPAEEVPDGGFDDHKHTTPAVAHSSAKEPGNFDAAASAISSADSPTLAKIEASLDKRSWMGSELPDLREMINVRSRELAEKQS